MARAGGGAGARGVDRPDRAADGAELPAHAGAHRRGQPAAARADHGRARRAGLRARGARDRPFRRRQRRADRRGGPRRPLAGGDVPDGDDRGQPRDRRRAVVRRPPGRGRADAGRRPDRLHLLPDADRHVGDDGDVHADDGAARGRLRRAHHRGPRHRVVGRPARRPRHRPARPAGPRARRGDLRLPGRRRAGAARGVAAGLAGGDGRDRRLDRCRQVDPREPRPAPLRRDRGRGAPRRGRRTPAGDGDALVAAGAGAAEGLPLPRDDRRQPALRQARRHRGRDVGGARDRPGPRVRRGDARAARRRGGPGRVEPQRRPAAADGDRTSRDPPARHLPLRRLLLRPRHHHRRAPAGRAAPGDQRRDGRDRGATGRDHPARRPDRGDGGRRRRRHRHHDELLADCATYREIVESQLTAEEVA